MTSDRVLILRATIRILVASSAITGCVALTFGVAGAQPTLPPGSPVPASSASPQAAVQQFASQLETLGANRFPKTFAGATFATNGVAVVYALPNDSALVSAVSSINTQHYPVTYVKTSRSYDSLNSLNQHLMAQQARLAASGVNLAESWPDPSTGKVDVSITSPTPSDLSALSAASGASAANQPVTDAIYHRAAAALITADAGPGYVVENKYGTTSTASGRNNDTAPFYDGDQITGGQWGLLCTGGFAVTGNASGNTFMLTAGHCGSGQWSTQAQVMGSTSPYGMYWENGSTNDFQTIGPISGGALGYVWVSGGGVDPVTGQLLPAVGSDITFDGSVTGEVPGNTVLAVNATDYNVYASGNGTYYDVYPVVQASNPNGSIICQPGDSGGPVFQRTPSPDMNAVGTIVAYVSIAGEPGGSECSAEQIGTEEAYSNSSLITG